MEVSSLDLLVTLARSLNRKVDPGSTLDRGFALPRRHAERGREPPGPTSSSRPAGRSVRQDGTLSYWRRPGKTGQVWSATTGPRGEAGDLLYVFSSNCSPFEPSKSYSKFAAYTLLHHGGDYAAAARELVRLPLVWNACGGRRATARLHVNGAHRRCGGRGAGAGNGRAPVPLNAVGPAEPFPSTCCPWPCAATSRNAPGRPTRRPTSRRCPCSGLRAAPSATAGGWPSRRAITSRPASSP